MPVSGGNKTKKSWPDINEIFPLPRLRAGCAAVQLPLRTGSSERFRKDGRSTAGPDIWNTRSDPGMGKCFLLPPRAASDAPGETFLDVRPPPVFAKEHRSFGKTHKEGRVGVGVQR